MHYLPLLKITEPVLDLNKATNRTPTENSNPAKPKHMKVNDIMTKSSLIIPSTVHNVYRVTQTSSENKIIDIKLSLLKTKTIKITHSSVIINEDQDSILSKLIKLNLSV